MGGPWSHWASWRRGVDCSSEFGVFEDKVSHFYSGLLGCGGYLKNKLLILNVLCTTDNLLKILFISLIVGEKVIVDFGK